MKKSASNFECGNCGQAETKAGDMNMCGRCHRVRYCNRSCQSAHWKKGGHKNSCLKPEACKPDFTEPRPTGDMCSICLDLLSASSTSSLACGHVLHSDCMASLDKCPICRNPNVNCVICFEPIGSEIFLTDLRCEHKMHAICFAGFHFQSFLSASLDLVCPISGCDQAVRPDDAEFKRFRVQSLIDMCAEKNPNSKYLLWLFLNTYDGDKTSPEDRVKCEVYALRALRAATSNEIRGEAHYNYGLVVEDPDAAITAFRRSIALIPHVGAMMELLKRNSLGMYDMFRLVELRPTDLPILKAVADDLDDCDGFQSPILVDFYECVLRRILDMDKTDGIFYTRLGGLLSFKFEYSIEEAEGLLRTAISLYEMEPFNANPYKWLGRVLMLKPGIGAADLEMFIRGVEIDGDASELFDYWMMVDQTNLDLVQMERIFMKTPEYGDFLRYLKEDIPAAEAFELKHISPARLPHPSLNLPRGVVSLKLTPLAAAQELECLD